MYSNVSCLWKDLGMILEGKFRPGVSQSYTDGTVWGHTSMITPGLNLALYPQKTSWPWTDCVISSGHNNKLLILKYHILKTCPL